MYVSTSVCLSVCLFLFFCLSVCPFVCLFACKYVYIRACQNEGLIVTLCACCETSLTILAPESWKSVNVQKVSQTDRMVFGGKR